MITTTTNLTQLSMSELKALCTSYAIEPVGDRRLKATWVNAIGLSAEESTVAIGLATPQPPTPLANSKRGASIVILMPLILLSVAIMAVQMSLRLVTPLIASVWRSTATWRSIPRSIYTSSLPLDYFPA